MATLLRGRYELLEKLGEGGMAEVYRARQLNLEREVAIKFIKVVGDTIEERFKREAKAVATLTHPHIVQVYDFDQAEDGRYFMVMELLQGSDLGSQLREAAQRGETFSLVDAATMIRQVADALHYAHQRGIIHRDIKPHNIFITDTSRVVVMDFGVARWVSTDKLTSTGMTIGTPHYFAPEQGFGGAVDHRVDIYALGVVFYELLTGGVPYKGDTPLSVIAQHANAPIPDPRQIRTDLPPKVTEIIQRAMAKNPSERYPTMAEFAAALGEVGGGSTAAFQTPSPRQTILSEHETIFPSVPDATTTIGTSPTGTRLRRPIPKTVGGMGIGLVILLLAGGILLLRGGGAADDQGSALVSDVPVAAEDEYLVVVAEFARKTQDSVDVPRRITDTLKAGDLVGILGERIRLEHSQIVVTSREKADALAEASGAQVIIWGVEDTTGLKVVVQAHGYPDKTLNELSFLIPAGQDFATTLAVDLPIAVSMNTRLMLFQRLLQDEELIAVLSLSISQKDVLEEEELNVVPTTPLDGYVMDALTAYALGDYEAADRSLSDAILLMPDDPGLYLLRWDVNLVYLSRPDRAQMDAEHIKRVLPADNLFTVLVDCYIALFAEDYPRVAEVTQGIEYRGKGDVFLQLMTYRALALLELGQFETLLDETAALDGEALEEILGLRADLAIAAIVQEMRGDDQAAEAGHEAIRTSRFLQTTSAQFTGNVPVGLILYGGYLSEANQEWVVATLAYQSGLLNDPDNYLLNWRKGIVAEQIATYPQAAEGYAQALKNAPAPFPIAAYQLAMLVQQHGEELDAPPDACRLLTQARKDAETNADFYAPLLEKIKAAWDAGGCV